MYGEGKSNYFKGSILILSYLVVVVGSYFSSFNTQAAPGYNPMDTLALGAGTLRRLKGTGFVEVGGRIVG
jgi:Ca2+:H+ antiporter